MNGPRYDEVGGAGGVLSEEALKEPVSWPHVIFGNDRRRVGLYGSSDGGDDDDLDDIGSCTDAGLSGGSDCKIFNFACLV